MPARNLNAIGRVNATNADNDPKPRAAPQTNVAMPAFKVKERQSSISISGALG
jgi:hypothetical protein